MANKKENNNKTQVDPAGSMSEKSPNPHGESKILKMPINTDQRNATGGRNVPQVPNTVGGKLNPSVVHEFKNRVLSEEVQDGYPESKRTRAPRRGKSGEGPDNSKKDA
jgi:hypothetical protein